LEAEECLNGAVSMRRESESPDLVQLVDAYVKAIPLRVELLLPSAADICTTQERPEAAQRMRMLPN